MQLTDAIKERRAVKHYDPSHKMTDEEVAHLFSMAKLSPTAFNQQNYRFVLVQDNELRKKLRVAAWDQAQVTDASMLIVLCADLKAWEKQPTRYWDNAPKEIQDYMVGAIDSYYRDLDRVQRDEAMRSCGIVAQTLMLMAKDMGYDSCPMDGFDFDAVGKLINLPDDHVVTMMVAIGKAAQPARPRPTQLEMDEIVIHDHF